jgi:hypothetical protein
MSGMPFSPLPLLKDRRKEYPAGTMLLIPKRRYDLGGNSFSRASLWKQRFAWCSQIIIR